MKKNRLRLITYMGLSMLLGILSTFGTLMASGNQAEGYTAQVLLLEKGYGNWDQGKLMFNRDQVVFQSSSGNELEEWAYTSVKKIDVAKPRLLKITLVSGQHFDFMSFGSETFNSKLVQFLRTNVKAPVQIKSEL